MQKAVTFITVLLLLQPIAARFMEEDLKEDEEQDDERNLNHEEKRWGALVRPAIKYGLKYGKPAMKHFGKWASAAFAAGLGSDAYKHGKAAVRKGYSWAKNKWRRWGKKRDALDEYFYLNEKLE